MTNRPGYAGRMKIQLKTAGIKLTSADENPQGPFLDGALCLLDAEPTGIGDAAKDHARMMTRMAMTLTAASDWRN